MSSATAMQTHIALPEGPSPLGPFQWCGDGTPAVGELTVRKARYRTHKAGGDSIKVVAKPALKAPACRKHLNSVRVEEERL